jgi:prepilin-type N-terminal cleavage/methylation domain-containing protein
MMNHKQKGFTLIELVVVMVVVGIVAVMMSSFIENWLQQTTLAQDRSSLLLDAQTAVGTINNDIKMSGDVDQNNRWPDANGPNGNQYGWTSSSSVLILAKAAVDKSNNIIFADPSQYISEKDNEIYYLSGTTLYRRTLASNNPSDAAVTTCPASDATSSCPPDLVVATNVKSVSFTYYDINGKQTANVSDARTVGVDLTLFQKLGNQTITASYTTRMVMRNV